MKALFCVITLLQIFTTNSWADDCSFSDEKLPNLNYELLGEIQGNKVFIHISKFEDPWIDPNAVAVKTVLTDQTVKYQNLDCASIVEISFDKVLIEDNTLIVKTIATDRYDASQTIITEKFKLDKDNNYSSISSISVDVYDENIKSFNLALKNKDLKTAVQARDYILGINRRAYDPYQSYETNIDICFKSFDLGFNILSNLFNKNRRSEYKKILSELLYSSDSDTNCLSILDIINGDRYFRTITENQDIELNQNQIKKLNNYANLLIKTKQYDLALDFLKVIIGTDPKNKDVYISFQEIYKKTNLKTFALMSSHIYAKLNGEMKTFSPKDLKVIAKEMKTECLKDETLKATYTEFLSYPSVRVDCNKGEINKMQFYWNPKKGKVLDFKFCPATGASSEIKTSKWEQELLNLSPLKNCNESSWSIQKPNCKWTVVCEGGLKEQIKSEPDTSSISEHVGLLDVVEIDEINDKIEVLRQTSATSFEYEIKDKILNIKEKIFFANMDLPEFNHDLGQWNVDCSNKDCVISEYTCDLPYLKTPDFIQYDDDDSISSPMLYAVLKYKDFESDYKKGQKTNYTIDYTNFYKIDVELMRNNQQSCHKN